MKFIHSRFSADYFTGSKKNIYRAYFFDKFVGQKIFEKMKYKLLLSARHLYILKLYYFFACWFL